MNSDKFFWFITLHQPIALKNCTCMFILFFIFALHPVGYCWFTFWLESHLQKSLKGNTFARHYLHIFYLIFILMLFSVMKQYKCLHLHSSTPAITEAGNFQMFDENCLQIYQGIIWNMEQSFFTADNLTTKAQGTNGCAPASNAQRVLLPLEH